MTLPFLLILVTPVLALSGASETSSPNPAPNPTETSKKEENIRSDKTQEAHRDNRPPKKTLPTIDPSKRPVASKESYDTSNEKSDPSTANWWIISFTGVLAFVAIIQLILYLRQARYFRTVEHAWLAVIFDQPFQPRVAKVTPISFTIKNTGNTVATRKKKKINAMRWESGYIPKRQLKPKPTGSRATLAVIFPGDKLTLDGLVDIPFTQADVDTAVSAPLLFDVYGYVAYNDVFGIRHITRFCQVYNPRTDGFDFPREAKPEYNDAD